MDEGGADGCGGREREKTLGHSCSEKALGPIVYERESKEGDLVKVINMLRYGALSVGTGRTIGYRRVGNTGRDVLDGIHLDELYLMVLELRMGVQEK